MSLVNDMLNDLDQRRAGESEANARVSQLASAASAIENKGNKREILLLIIVVLVVSAYGLYYWLGQSSDSEQVQPLAQKTERRTTESDQPTNITKPELQETGQQTHQNAEPVQSRLHEPATVAIVKEQNQRVNKPAQVSSEYQKSEKAIDEVKVVETAQVTETKSTGRTDTVKAKEKPPEARFVKKAISLTPAQRDKKTSQEAYSLVRKRQYAQAEDLLRSYLDGSPSAARSGELYARLLSRSGRTAEAKELLTSLITSHPENTKLVKTQANLLISSGELDQAAELLAARQINVADDPEYYEIMGVVEQRRGEFEQASEIYRQLTAYNGRRGDWWVGYGIAQENSGQLDAALKSYQRALLLPETKTTLLQYAEARIAVLR